MSQPAADNVLPSGDNAREQWARWVFQLPADLPAEEVRGEVLRRLAARGFAPPPVWRDAMALFDPPLERLPADGRPPLEYQRAYERWLRKAMEAFAGDFFDLPPARRQAVWIEFSEASAPYPQLRARLEQLRPGLELDLAGLRESDPRVRKLANWIAGLFTSRPLTAATMRRRFLRSTEADIAGWQRAARRLRRRHPKIAALAPGVVEQLADAKQRLARLRSGKRPAQPMVAQKRSQGGSGWAIALVVFAALTIGRVFSNLEPPKSPRPPIPRYTIPEPPAISFPIAPIQDRQPDGTPASPADPQSRRAASEALTELFGGKNGVIERDGHRFRLEYVDGKLQAVPLDDDALSTEPPPVFLLPEAPSTALPPVPGSEPPFLELTIPDVPEPPSPPAEEL